MTIYALGPEGTFSHEMACRLEKTENIRLVPAIGQVFEAVEKGLGDGIIPIENSEAGAVGPTLDGLVRYRVWITAESCIEIHHHLASFSPLQEVGTVYVHPQTAEQCSEFLNTLSVSLVFTPSNAASAVELLKDRKAAAVVSSRIADLYGVPIVRKSIENNPNNVTRFVRISSVPGGHENGEKCSIIIDPETDRPGLLYDLLGVFARRGINLCRIESRPSKRGMGSYIFFMDISRTPGCADAIRELTGLSGIKFLGCYSKAEAVP
jgi:prephenate dehydratase